MPTPRANRQLGQSKPPHKQNDKNGRQKTSTDAKRYPTIWTNETTAQTERKPALRDQDKQKTLSYNLDTRDRRERRTAEAKCDAEDWSRPRWARIGRGNWRQNELFPRTPPLEEMAI